MVVAVTLQDAVSALEAARIPAWRRWRKALYDHWKTGATFDEGLGYATKGLIQELQPHYDALHKAYTTK